MRLPLGWAGWLIRSLGIYPSAGSGSTSGVSVALGFKRGSRESRHPEILLRPEIAFPADRS